MQSVASQNRLERSSNTLQVGTNGSEQIDSNYIHIPLHYIELKY